MATNTGLTIFTSLLALAAAAAATKARTSANTDKVTVVSGKTTPAARPTPTPTATPTPTPTATAAALPVLTRLAPLDFSDMRLWNYAGKWHASEWGDAFSPIGWKFDHITQPNGTDAYFKLDAAGAPELQAGGGTPVSSRAMWETEVTLPKLKDGLVVAPLWIWDSNSSDEVDFEYAGRKGLDVTLHAAVNGSMQTNSVRLFAGRDMSGERHRFGIKVDETAGYVEMYFDGTLVQRWSKANMAFFVSHTMKPMISMWAADPNNAGFVSWVGKWPGLTTGETLSMTVHGYGYTPLP